MEQKLDETTRQEVRYLETIGKPLSEETRNKIESQVYNEIYDNLNPIEGDKLIK